MVLSKFWQEDVLATYRVLNAIKEEVTTIARMRMMIENTHLKITEIVDKSLFLQLIS